MFIPKKKVIVAVILIIAAITVIFLNYSKDCKYDSECFNSYSKVCKKASVTLIKDRNEQYFEILSLKGNSCMVFTKVTYVNTETSPEIKKMLLNKGMICEIPKKVIAENEISKIPSFTDYCTGPLKEALLQISIEQMYNVIVKNIGTKALESYENAFGAQG